ncbi:MAG: hypothetical protein QG620_424 [Patescibacteria group bacterium]|nr:hypothetical protein [Patescibacteria group bacterium]
MRKITAKQFVRTQSTSLWRYVVDEAIWGSLFWVPTLVGVGLRYFFYGFLLKNDGFFYVDNNVRIKMFSNVILGKNAYLDYGCYLHACPSGIEIGENSVIMHNSVIHVFNFVGLPHASIKIGRGVFIGENSVIRGQGGVTIGNDCLISPKVSILAVNHSFASADLLIKDQPLDAKGIIIGDDVWVGGGATILDGVKIGRGSVIGAGSVVTKDIPEFSVAVGNPAKVVKSRKK